MFLEMERARFNPVTSGVSQAPESLHEDKHPKQRSMSHEQASEALLQWSAILTTEKKNRTMSATPSFDLPAVLASKV